MCVRSLARTRNLLSQLNEKVPTAKVWEDNQPAIAWAEKGGMRTKHIDVRFHYVCDEFKRGAIGIDYCPIDKMEADALTKPICADKVKKFVTNLSIVS